MIKYGESLQSHQDGPSFEIFKLINSDNIESQEYVKYGDRVVIARDNQTGDKVYLGLEADKSINSQSTLDKAIRFSLSLIRPCEPNHTHLCICANEVIFP